MLIFVRSFVRPFVHLVLACLKISISILRMTGILESFRVFYSSQYSSFSPRSVSGLSVLTSSDRRSLEYFVLLLEGSVNSASSERN